MRPLTTCDGDEKFETKACVMHFSDCSDIPTGTNGCLVRPPDLLEDRQIIRTTLNIWTSSLSKSDNLYIYLESVSINLSNISDILAGSSGGSVFPIARLESLENNPINPVNWASNPNKSDILVSAEGRLIFPLTLLDSLDNSPNSPINSNSIPNLSDKSDYSAEFSISPDSGSRQKITGRSFHLHATSEDELTPPVVVKQGSRRPPPELLPLTARPAIVPTAGTEHMCHYLRGQDAVVALLLALDEEADFIGQQGVSNS